MTHIEDLSNRNIDLLEKLLNIRELAESATDLEAFRAAVLNQCARATEVA